MVTSAEIKQLHKDTQNTLHSAFRMKRISLSTTIFALLFQFAKVILHQIQKMCKRTLSPFCGICGSRCSLATLTTLSSSGM